MKRTAKRIKGDIGEDIVANYLKNKGFFVHTRNYWKPWGEIDIIAEKANTLSFIEVKTVTRESEDSLKVRPEENLHPAKLRRIHRAIQTYLLDHNVPESKDWKIDLACVYLNFSTHKARVEILENVI